MTVEDPGTDFGGWTISLDLNATEYQFLKIAVRYKGHTLFGGYISTGQTGSEDIALIAVEGTQMLFETDCGHRPPESSST